MLDYCKQRKMPGLNKKQLALIKAQVDMYTKHNLLMRKIYDNLFLLQPEMYIVSNPEPVKSPTVIKVQMIWNSKSCGKHVSFSRALKSQENYEKGLKEIYAVFRYAIDDAETLGISPYEGLLYGVNYS